MSNDLVVASPDALTPHGLSEAMQLANLMTKAKVLPKHLQNDPGTCLMVIEQAMRWRMSPFAVAQCTSNIGGKLMFEGKLVAAACQSIGAIVGHFDYAFDGEGDQRSVTVSATRTGESEPRAVKIAWWEVATENVMWKKQPDQQLVYAGTRVWARRWAPAAILGVYSPEEFDVGTVIDGAADATETNGNGNGHAKPKSGLMDASVRQAQEDAVTTDGPTYEERKAQWLDELQGRMDGADTIEEGQTILDEKPVAYPERVFKNDDDAIKKINDLKTTMIKRIWQGIMPSDVPAAELAP